MMRAVTIPVLILAGIALIPPEVSAGTTYSLQNYSAYQSGWNLSGSITIDQIGNSPNITGWSYELRNGSQTLDFSSTDSGAGLSAFSLSATSSELRLANGGGYLNLYVGLEELIYNNGSNGVTYAQGNFIFPGGFNRWFAGNPNLDGNSDGWLIGTATSTAVPEPSTAILSAFGAVVLIAHGWFRHRREQRRQAAA